MSSPADNTRSSAAPNDDMHNDPNSGLFMRVADDLVPHFVHSPTSHGVAIVHTIAMRAVLSYLPNTAAELITAGRIVSLSLTSLGLLRDAAQPGMAPDMKLKHIRTAVAVERAACQMETQLERRRKQRHAMADAEADTQTDTAVASDAKRRQPGPLEAQIRAAGARVMAEQAAYQAAQAAAEQAPAESPWDSAAYPATEWPPHADQSARPPPETDSAADASIPPVAANIAEPAPQRQVHEPDPGAQPAAPASSHSGGDSSHSIYGLSPDAFTKLLHSQDGLTLHMAELRQRHDEQARMRRPAHPVNGHNRDQTHNGTRRTG